MFLRPFLAAVLAACAIAASATPQVRNGTDMWFNPAESGWGLNLFHQGDTIFAALFVYGQDNQPRWYVASALTGGDAGPWSGALYEGNGPWFGGAFDPNAVTRRQVGTMAIQLGDDSGLVQYTVDGVSVTKQIVPFTFRALPLTALYRGFELQPASGGAEEIRKDNDFQIRDNGSGLELDTGSDSQSSCGLGATASQSGSIVTLRGDGRGPNGIDDQCAGKFGSWSLRLDPTPHGFTAAFVGDGIAPPLGRVVMARRFSPQMDGTGWRNDIWFPPNESGWGLNVVEQGDTIFATIFVYDMQQRTHWYVASQLTQSGSAYSGALYEMTGPYFGGTFDPAKVVHRQVGTMTFNVRDSGTASLDYSVDGVAVSKMVSRFAFRKNDLSGRYVGHVGPADNWVEITIADGDGGFSMQTLGHDGAASCNYTAPSSMQLGDQRFVSGTFTCGTMVAGSFQLQDAFVTFDGFTAGIQHTFTSRSPGFEPENGNMEGARR